jgi:hypothetical protein
LKRAVFPDPLAPEIWDCDPLVVVGEDDEVAYAGRTRIQVQPLGGDRYNLESEEGRDGRLPELIDAERVVIPEMIQLDSMIEYDVLTRGKRRGATFRGRDKEGAEFTWYINSAADAFLTQQRAADTEEPSS